MPHSSRAGSILPEIPFDVYPGPYGGVETNMAVSDGVVYAAVVNLPGHVKTPADLDKPVLPVDFSEGTGTIVALDVATGEIKWQQDIDQMPFGAMTVSNDLVFTTTFDGKVRAYSTDGRHRGLGERAGRGYELATGDRRRHARHSRRLPPGRGSEGAAGRLQAGRGAVTPPLSRQRRGADPARVR